MPIVSEATATVEEQPGDTKALSASSFAMAQLEDEIAREQPRDTEASSI